MLQYNLALTAECIRTLRPRVGHSHGEVWTLRLSALTKDDAKRPSFWIRRIAHMCVDESAKYSRSHNIVWLEPKAQMRVQSCSFLVPISDDLNNRQLPCFRSFFGATVNRIDTAFFVPKTARNSGVFTNTTNNFCLLGFLQNQTGTIWTLDLTSTFSLFCFWQVSFL